MKKINVKDTALETTFNILETTGWLGAVAIAAVPLLGAVCIYKKLSKNKKRAN